MQGTRVQALVQEDPTCRGATKHQLSRAPRLLSLLSRAGEPQLLKPVNLEPVLRNKRSHHNEKSPHTAMKSSPRSPQLEKAHARTQQRRPNTAINK